MLLSPTCPATEPLVCWLRFPRERVSFVGEGNHPTASSPGAHILGCWKGRAMPWAQPFRSCCAQGPSQPTLLSPAAAHAWLLEVTAPSWESISPREAAGRERGRWGLTSAILGVQPHRLMLREPQVSVCTAEGGWDGSQCRRWRRKDRWWLPCVLLLPWCCPTGWAVAFRQLLPAPGNGSKKPSRIQPATLTVS